MNKNEKIIFYYIKDTFSEINIATHLKKSLK